ncbi:MAG: 5'-nucleotidase C-terminal domain-containing protein [Chitinophagaceae bacterium]|nr:5'-nucleotidase C-terminal domain-containing protein [Chitinophagaceae bacterium]
MNKQRRTFIKNIGLLSAAACSTQGLSAMDLLEDDKNIISLSILQTTDVHCQIHPHDELFWEHGKMVFRKTGGYAQLASYLKKQRALNSTSFLIDTGDMFQGSELSVKTTGKAMVPILNELGYDLYLPGNWEVIYYKKAMQELLGALNGPKVCANMYHDAGDGKKGELIFKPYHIWEEKGIKIGFIGYTDPWVPIRQSPNYSKGIVYSRPEDNLPEYVKLLREKEQCAFVIILAHLGLSQQISLANMPECKGVDYILGGDTHERVREPIKCKYAKVVEPGAFGSFVGKLDLQFKNGKLVRDNYELVEIGADKYTPDEKIGAIIKENEKPFQQNIENIVGYSTIPLYRYFVVENTIDTLVLNALHWQLPEIDVVLSNGFRFCPPRNTPDTTGNIPITEGYVYDMLPVNSTVRKAKVSGKQVRDWMERELNNVFAENAADRLGGWVIKFKGMEVSFRAFAKYGDRVQKIKIGGEPIENEKIYSICACEREGDPSDMLCRMRNVKEASNTPYSLHQVLFDYLKTNSPVTPTPPHAAIILDGPENMLTQVRGVDYKFR